MQREIRRKDRQLDDESALLDILMNGEYGVLSTVGSEGQPYGVPISYVLDGNAIYVHCAPEGHKLDNIAHQPQVSFCVVGMAQPIYDQSFSTYYTSVIAFGKMVEVTNESEKINALTMLCEKYLPEHMDKVADNIAMSLSRTAVYRLDIERMTGKSKR